MTLKLGSTAPNFTQHSTEGMLDFYNYAGDGWVVLFTHPKDFTPVCTTELGAMASLKPEFDKRNVKILGLGVDPVDAHVRWSRDIEETQGHGPNYPIIADVDLKVAKLYGMLPEDAGDSADGRTAMDNATVRNVYVIGPDKKIKLMITYPMTTGRNFDEVLRVIDSLQLTAKHSVATPVNWQQGEEVIIVPAVSDEKAKSLFPAGWRAPKPYMRFVAQPN
ncbi:MAG: peroxiredoxin [Pseudomonadota bacterium]